MSATTIRKSRTVRPGLVELLDAAAKIIETEAAALKRSHTINGRWSKRDPVDVEVRKAFDEMLAVARGLRLASEYWAPNGLGGPAKRFWAIADRVQAGEQLDSVMADYGVRWID